MCRCGGRLREPLEGALVPVRVLIVEDHVVVSQALEALLSCEPDIEVVGSVRCGESALKLIEDGAADLVLMDVRIEGDMSGIEATRRVKKLAPGVRVLMLSMIGDPNVLSEAVKAGADGYLCKSASGESLVKAIADVHAGNRVFDPAIGLEGHSSRGSVSPRTLTSRELEVLGELAHGQPTQAIAHRLDVSEETIKTYVKTILRKLGAHHRAEAVAEAFRRGLVT